MYYFDLSLFHLINDLAGRNAGLDAVMICIAKFSPLVFALILLRSWFLRPVERLSANRTAVIHAVCAALIGLGINQIIGHLFFRTRPYAEHAVRLLLERSPDPSFPSDHSTGAFSIALTLFLHDRKSGGLALAFATLLALSRVYTGVHYPLDIAGGAATGLLATAVVLTLRTKLEPTAQFVQNLWGRISCGR